MASRIQLPLRVYFNQGVAVRVYITLAFAAIVNLGIMWLGVNTDPMPHEDCIFLLGGPVVTFFVTAAILLFFAFKYSSYAVDIQQDRLSVQQLPIFGFAKNKPATFSVVNFAGIQLFSQILPKAYLIQRLRFCGKDGKTNIIFDAPKGVDKLQFLTELAAELNLTVLPTD